MLTDTLAGNGVIDLGELNRTLTTSQGTCSVDASWPTIITCHLNDLAAGERVTVTYKVKALEPLDLNNDALVQSDTPDPDTSNNQDQEALSFIRARHAHRHSGF